MVTIFFNNKPKISIKELSSMYNSKSSFKVLQVKNDVELPDLEFDFIENNIKHVTLLIEGENGGVFDLVVFYNGLMNTQFSGKFFFPVGSWLSDKHIDVAVHISKNPVLCFTSLDSINVIFDGLKKIEGHVVGYDFFIEKGSDAYNVALDLSCTENLPNFHNYDLLWEVSQKDNIYRINCPQSCFGNMIFYISLGTKMSFTIDYDCKIPYKIDLSNESHKCRFSGFKLQDEYVDIKCFEGADNEVFYTIRIPKDNFTFTTLIGATEITLYPVIDEVVINGSRFKGKITRL
jgi:hypothetical protein